MAVEDFAARAQVQMKQMLTHTASVVLPQEHAMLTL